VRTRKTEEEEVQRLNTMSGFRMLSEVGNIKPGRRCSPRSATFGGLAPRARGPDLWQGTHRGLDDRRPLALGASTARPGGERLDRSWRQTVRWLVGDVNGRVEASVKPKAEAAASAVEIAVRVRDAEYRPLDNAKVALKITLPAEAI